MYFTTQPKLLQPPRHKCLRFKHPVGFTIISQDCTDYYTLYIWCMENRVTKSHK